MPLRYMNPASTSTLGEAIFELRRAEGVDDMADLSDLATTMEPHAAVHVLFGCSTSLLGEVQAHLWMLMGTTTPLAEMHRAASSRDHSAVLKEIGLLNLLATWARALPTVASIFLRSRQMTRRWDATDLERCFDRPLVELRAEYGIRLPRGAAKS